MSADPLPTAASGSQEAVPCPRTTARGKLADDVVWSAISMVEGSGLVERAEEWKAQERQGPGGRRETFPVRAVLVAMLLCALTDQPLHATRVTDVLFRQLSPTMRHALGVPKPPAPGDRLGWQAVYRNVRTRLHGLIGLLDPSPNPKNRRLDAEAFDRETKAREATRSPEDWAGREERLTWVVNVILEMSLRRLPRDVRRRWRGSVAVDATVVPAFARPDRREQRTRKGKRPRVLVHSSDPDADWYTRGQRTGDEGPEGFHSTWGYELTMAVTGNEDPDTETPFPSLAAAMAPLHKPGHEPGKQAATALASLHARGHPAHYVAADRAYTNAKPEDFQLPARALGYQPVLDYKIDQLGVQDSHDGMLLIEGAWYCPSIPGPLVEATRDFRNGIIDGVTYAARLEERWKYRVVPKQQPDEGGHIRVQCPAAGFAPKARCELKPRSESARTRGRLLIPVTSSVRDHPPRICTQQSVTLPPEAGAKFAQPLLFGSEEWRRAYSTLRNSIEGMNGFVKDGAHEALDDPERRRIRGRAAQSLFAAFLLCAANLRKIDAFLAQEAAVRSGTVRRLPRRRTTRDLGYWAPKLPKAPAIRGPTPGPDPPQTA